MIPTVLFNKLISLLFFFFQLRQFQEAKKSKESKESSPAPSAPPPPTVQIDPSSPATSNQGQNQEQHVASFFLGDATNNASCASDISAYFGGLTDKANTDGSMLGLAGSFANMNMDKDMSTASMLVNCPEVPSNHWSTVSLSASVSDIPLGPPASAFQDVGSSKDALSEEISQVLAKSEQQEVFR